MQPLTFLPLAEEAGLMGRLNGWCSPGRSGSAPFGVPPDAACVCRST